MITTLTLSPAAGSFPFPTKVLSLPSGTKVVLGSTEISPNAPRQSLRVATTSNGWFPPTQTEDNSISLVSPLPLSSAHAEIWSEGGRIFIRDLDSAFGTYVNGLRISKDATLKAGDTISLGTRIARNAKTPAYITDFHLIPIIATVTPTNVSA
ncbi:hypothetical protein CVT24_007763 [Panaeolus cyanescens]|uniref:FHA domain-containing protein n=1 Tax=Panaeolus cyanescens TaxID=181874 RepID=A0A409YKN2_9AGAR|nr:hypothetical protein CVT24_007763 [Panaeolus cyanescens]